MRILAMMALAAAAAHAQDLLYVEGAKDPVKGVIVEETYKQVTILDESAGGNRVSIATEKIREITYDKSRKPQLLDRAQGAYQRGDCKTALDLCATALKGDPKGFRQHFLFLAAQARAGAGEIPAALAALEQLRKDIPETKFLRDSYLLAFECGQSMKDGGQACKAAIQDLRAKSRDLGMVGWARTADLMEAALLESAGSYDQAWPLYKKHSGGDDEESEKAKLGELRCLTAKQDWGTLKSRCDSFMKKGSPLLQAACSNGLGEIALKDGKNKDAVKCFLRGVLGLSIDMGPVHETALGKGAIAAARHAHSLKEASGKEAREEKEEYLQNARGLLTELRAKYPSSPLIAAAEAAISGK